MLMAYLQRSLPMRKGQVFIRIESVVVLSLGRLGQIFQVPKAALSGSSFTSCVFAHVFLGGVRGGYQVPEAFLKRRTAMKGETNYVFWGAYVALGWVQAVSGAKLFLHGPYRYMSVTRYVFCSVKVVSSAHEKCGQVRFLGRECFQVRTGRQDYQMPGSSWAGMAQAFFQRSLAMITWLRIFYWVGMQAHSSSASFSNIPYFTRTSQGLTLHLVSPQVVSL